jgi:ABC-2 type transport system ATP-binding protein
MEGESVALLGPNGAGKTTTMKMMTGILYPTAGSCNVLGYNPNKRNPAMLKNIGFVMGNKSTLSMDLSPMQNYELNRVIYDIDATRFYNTIDELGELLEVKDHLYKQTRKLSLGQRMKAEMINSILHRPKILFLDEPTIGLDISSQNNIRTFLKKVNKELGTTIILTSHNMEDISQVSERVLIINQGKLVYDNSLEMLKRTFSTKKYIKVIVTTKGNSRSFEKKFKPFGDIVSSGKDFVTLEIDKNRQAPIIAAILNMEHVHDIDIEGVPLTKIIETIFKKKLD